MSKLQLGGDRVVTPAESIGAARAFFLDAVARLAPAVVDDLDGLPANPSGADVSAWARRSRLNAPWVLDVARETIAARRAHLVAGATKPAARWFELTESASGWAPVGAPSYDPRRESRAAYQQRVDAYVTGCEDGRGAAPLKDPSHFEWAVRYQVKGESFATIARGVPSCAGRTAIRNAVHRLARFLELPLRSSR